MLDKRPMSAFPNTEEFLAAHPEHDDIHAYIVGLAEFMPEEFVTEPTPGVIESLAYMVTGRNYGGAYLMAGSMPLLMLREEFEERDWYEECRELTEVIRQWAPYNEPLHAELLAKRRQQSSQNCAD